MAVVAEACFSEVEVKTVDLPRESRSSQIEFTFNADNTVLQEIEKIFIRPDVVLDRDFAPLHTLVIEEKDYEGTIITRTRMEPANTIAQYNQVLASGCSVRVVLLSDAENLEPAPTN